MTKKAYEKPKVSKVGLKPSEAVLTACKGPRDRGAQIGSCKAIGGGGICYTRTRT